MGSRVISTRKTVHVRSGPGFFERGSRDKLVPKEAVRVSRSRCSKSKPPRPTPVDRRAPSGDLGGSAYRSGCRILGQRWSAGRKRVLQLMGENGLLSLHCGRKGTLSSQHGLIVTDGFNERWGTGGVHVQTANDGWYRVFSAMEHYDAECGGWHVCKHGDRFAAREPISQSMKSILGPVDKDAARGSCFGWTTGVSTYPITSSNRYATGTSRTVALLLSNVNPTESWSARIERSKSRQSTGKSSTRSTMYVRSAADLSIRTTRTDTSIKGRRKVCCAMRPSGNLCPRHRVCFSQYNTHDFGNQLGRD